MRFRELAAGGACLVVAAALGLSACGGSDDSTTDEVQTFSNSAYPFTFQYPGSLTETTDVSTSQNLGAGATQDNVGLALDDSNLVLLEKSTLNIAVTDQNLDQAQREFDQLIGQIDSGASAKPGDTGGFPSLTYTDVPVSSVTDGQSRLTFLFDGKQEYVVNCQSTPDHRDAIESACDQILSTLKPS